MNPLRQQVTKSAPTPRTSVCNFIRDQVPQSTNPLRQQVTKSTPASRTSVCNFIQDQVPQLMNPLRQQVTKLAPIPTQNLTSQTKYGYAANQLLKTVSIDMHNVKQWAILDSGATSNFLMTETHTFSVTPTDEPISVTLPDGNKVQLTHKCVLDFPQFPESARNGHIIPGSASNSLVSVVVLCNAGCEVTLKAFDVTVKYKGKIVLTGTKCMQTVL